MLYDKGAMITNLDHTNPLAMLHIGYDHLVVKGHMSENSCLWVKIYKNSYSSALPWPFLTKIGHKTNWP